MREHHGSVVWFSGLSGAGKTTLARAVAARLGQLGWRVEVVDGDELRRELSAGLGFSRADREENARRAACMARALARHPDFVLVALIAPYRALRAEIGASLPNYVEVYVNAPLEVCEARDPKGLYRRARAGRVKNFTGIDDPYEPPRKPALECLTNREPIEQSVENVLHRLTRGALATGNCLDLLHAALDATPGIRMAEFALRLGVSPRALASRLRHQGDQGFRQIREARLLAQAKAMLGRKCAVKEVAIHLGFGSTQAFDRFFQRCCGESPGNFRIS